jgi:hypothetical protein
MVKSEIIKQSPLRILDESTHGGVGDWKPGRTSGQAWGR